MSIYEELGVKTYINAWGTITAWGGSVMPDAIWESMRDAGRNFIELKDLLQKTGERIAIMTHNEGAYITSGAAGGIMLVAAWMLTRGDPDRYHRLPADPGPRSEILTLACQHNGFLPAISAVGATIVEAGDPEGCDINTLSGTITDQTTGIFYFPNTHAPSFSGQEPSLEQMVAIARQFNLPVAVDGASQIPPIDNLWRYTHAGADAAIFSGGKAVKGPQCTGLIVGRRDITSALLQMGNPNHGLARACKVGKEEIVGLYAAIHLLIESDQDSVREARARIVRRVAAGLGEHSSPINVRISNRGPAGEDYPMCVVEIRNRAFPAASLIAACRDDTPGVILGVHRTDPYCFYINPINLKEQDADIVVSQVIKHARFLNP